MANKTNRNSPGMLMPTFKINKEGIEIVPAPYRSTDQQEVDLVLDAVEAEEFEIAYDEVPRLLDKYPLDFDVINAYMLALNEIDGGMAALTFFEGKLQRFYKFLSERTRRVAGTGGPDRLAFPGDLLGNRPFLRALYNSGLFLVREGREAEAMDRFTQLLVHDPATHYEARTFILHLAIKNGRIEDLPRMSHVKIPAPVTGDSTGSPSGMVDPGVGMKFGWGLYFFLAGDQVAARRWFEAGIRQNPNVVKFMFQGMQPDDEDAVNYSFATGTYSPGDESEAIGYIEAWFDTWHQNPDALGFLREISLELGAHDERVFHLRVTMRHVLPTVSRLVAISSTCTFQDLARVICEALGWSGTREHEFVVTARTARSDAHDLADKIKELLADESFTIGMYDPEADEEFGYYDGLDDDDDDDDDEGEAGVAEVEEVACEGEDGEGGTAGDLEGDEASDDGGGELGDPISEPDYYEVGVTLYEMFMKKEARAVFTYDFDAYWEFDIVVDRVLPRDATTHEAIVLESCGHVPEEDAGGPTLYMAALLDGKIGGFSSEKLKGLSTQYEKVLAEEDERARKGREQLERTIKESIERRRKKTMSGDEGRDVASDDDADADDGDDGLDSN